MREGWKEIEIGDVAPYWNGKISAKVLDENNFISADNMFPDKGGITKSSYAPNSGKATSFKRKDILVSNIRPYFKKIWFADKNGGCSNDVIVFRTNNDIADSAFVYYYLSKDDFFDFMMAGANGTKMPRGNKKAIPQYKINLPPLKTQRKIASILSAYNDLIETNLKRIKLLEEQAQQTYEEWFVRLKFPGYEDVAIDEVSGLPVGWEKEKLVDCCDLIMGQSPKSEFYNNEKLGLPFHQGVKDYGFRFPANSSWSTQGNRKAEEDSILFSVRAPVGRLNVAIEKIIIGRGIASINHKKGWNGFLLYQLQNIFYEDNLMGGGAIYNSVTKTDVQRIELVHATKEINVMFNNLSSNIDKQIKNLTIQNHLLKEVRDILLPRLMSGMIDVESLEVNEKLGMVAEEHVGYEVKK